MLQHGFFAATGAKKAPATQTLNVGCTLDAIGCVVKEPMNVTTGSFAFATNFYLDFFFIIFGFAIMRLDHMFDVGLPTNQTCIV